MTNGPTPTPPPRNEGEYARKLALAILGTLESKGLLTQLDVDTILHVAHRSASAAAAPEPAPAPQPQTSPPKAPGAVGPAALDTRWVKKDSNSSQGAAAQEAGPTLPKPDDTGNVIIIPDPAESEAATAAKEKAEPQKEADKPALKPMVIDFTLD